MQHDILSDLLTRIRNGYNAKLLSIIVLNSKFSLLILNLLLRLGFISSFVIISKRHILVFLLYYRNQSALRYVNRVSKINNRIFITKNRFIKLYFKKWQIQWVLYYFYCFMGCLQIWKH